MDLRLYGRGLVVTFVEEALKRKGVSARSLPVVLLVGSPGSGGTVLLTRLWDEFGADAPGVHIDIAPAQEMGDVVLAAMQGLQVRISGIRRITFPRLSLALKALAFVDDGGGRASFDAYMRAGGNAAMVNSALPVWSDRAAKLLQSTEQQFLAALVTQVLSGLLSSIDLRKDSKAQGWYATNKISSGGKKYDPLWELYRWRHDPSFAAPRKADKTLCAALLADLRTDFNDSSFFHGQRTANCLLLLDNAGGKIGSRLLELLDECRRDSRRADESGDPVLVVAVQHGLPAQTVGEPIEATDENLRFDRFKGAGADWCPVRLTDLGDGDVLNMTTSSVLGSARRDADFIHALTGGHPAAARYLVAFMTRPELPAFDARRLLEYRLPADHELLHDPPRSGESCATVEDHLLSLLFADELPEVEMLDAMAVCAATPGLRHAACQAACRFLGWPDVDVAEVRDRLTDVMWFEEDGDDHRLHPLAGLLFRHWLMRDPDRWHDVHRGYVTHYARREDIVLRHHHELALVEPSSTQLLETIAGYLEGELDGWSAEQWLRTLKTITDAPNRVRVTRDPRPFVTTIAGAAERGDRHRVIARLTVALWLFNDRHLDPGHSLAQVIANEYDNLAQLPTPDGEAFYRESAKYRKIEREWED